MTGLVYFLLVGLVAGFLGGKIMRGGGFGAVGNIVVGIIGAVVGGVVFDLFGLSSRGLTGSLVTATVGAVVFLYVVGLLKRA